MHVPGLSFLRVFFLNDPCTKSNRRRHLVRHIVGGSSSISPSLSLALVIYVSKPLDPREASEVPGLHNKICLPASKLVARNQIE